jgi:hypothetical protein
MLASTPEDHVESSRQAGYSTASYYQMFMQGAGIEDSRAQY